MDKLIDIALCSGVVLLELFAIIITALLIQIILYRIFNINLYKGIIKALKKLDKNLEKVFYI